MNTRFICTQCGRFEDSQSPLRLFDCVSQIIKTTCSECLRKAETSEEN